MEMMKGSGTKYMKTRFPQNGMPATRRINCDCIFRDFLLVSVAVWSLIIGKAPIYGADETNVKWGVCITDGGNVLHIPSVASSGTDLGCMTVLPPTADAKRGTLICRVGSRWQSKRVEPAGHPDDHFSDSILFINLDNGSYWRCSNMHPSPNFVVQSPDGKYFAFGNSVGWSLTEQSRRDLFGEGDDTLFRGSRLLSSDVKRRLAASCVGTILYSVWETSSQRPIWEMRFPADSKDVPIAKFVRPWENNGDLEVPWWAINEDPHLYCDPVMGFSPDSSFFVALSSYYGVQILNLGEGTQSSVSPVTEQHRPMTYVFRDKETIEIFRSDSSSLRVRIADGQVLGTTMSDISSPSILGTEVFGKDAYPLFCTDSTRVWTASLKGDRLRIGRPQLSDSAILETRITLGAMTTGVSRMEVSRNKRWAGINITTMRETAEQLRNKDNGKTCRFERIDLHSGRIVERVVSSTMIDAAQMREKFANDSVPTVFVAPVSKVLTMGACLNAQGDGIVYAIPILNDDAE